MGRASSQIRLRDLVLACVCLLVLLSSCSSKVTSTILKEYPPLPLSTQVKVLEKNASIPSSSQHIGDTEVKDTGFSTRCSYNYGIHSMSMEALNIGGNLVQIIEHREPTGMGSTCHRFKAKIYRVPEASLDSLRATDVTESSEYYEKEIPVEVSDRVADADKLNKRPRIALNIGYSYLLAQAPDQSSALYERYINELRSGSHISASFHAFLSRKLALGARYSLFSTEHSLYPVEFVDPSGNVFIGTLKDDIKTHYFGPSMIFRSRPGLKGSFAFFGISTGIMIYDNKTIQYEAFRIQGTDLGLNLFAGFDLALTKDLAIGIEANLLSGSLGSLKITDSSGKTETVQLELEDRESLTRFDLSVGLRFRL